MNSGPEKWHGNKFVGFSLCLFYHKLSAQGASKQKIPKGIKQKTLNKRQLTLAKSSKGETWLEEKYHTPAKYHILKKKNYSNQQKLSKELNHDRWEKGTSPHLSEWC